MYGTREGWLTPPADAGLLLDKYLESSGRCYHKNGTEINFLSVKQNRLKWVLLYAKVGYEIRSRRWGAPVRSSWVVLSLFMSISNKNMLQTNTCHYYHIWAPAFTRYNRGQFNEGKIMELHELGAEQQTFQ